MTAAEQNFNYQKTIAITGVLLFIIKIVAWYITQSVAILTDALESTVNVASAFIGLYSLYVSAKPRDSSHPYGHGKVEFISAAIEGALISGAGVLIIVEALKNLGNPHAIGKLDYGIILIGVTAVVNYVIGEIAVRKGRNNGSLALVASGKHLQSDTWSTIGILVGLVLLLLTGLAWLDSAVALVFAFLIVYTGFRIIRDALSGIMDEADEELLKSMVELLQEKRGENWIDLHNTRIIKYGSTLHIDCHLTIPWYFNVHEAHAEIDRLGLLVREGFGNMIEMSVHSDGCLDFSCGICSRKECPVRKTPFKRVIGWTVKNISDDRKHRLMDPE
ncbi:MAG: cation transporter [Chlorobiaceae bacterium]|nr:cation transporter [Chlorobiaceae bacterium]